MTARTLAAFAAGALVGSLVQAVYDARGETPQRRRAVLPENRGVASAFATSFVGEMGRHEKTLADHEERIARLEEERATMGARVAAGLREGRAGNGPLRLADLAEHVQEPRKESFDLRDSVRQSLESAGKSAYKLEHFVELGEQLLDGLLDRGRLLALFEPICKSGDLGLAVGVLDALTVVHRGSPSSSGRTGEGSGAGGSRTSPPAPTSGARP